MYTSSFFRACLLILLVSMSPCAAFAAGLGKLTINSALGQPLDAEIDLVAVKNEDISSLAAKLGSHEAFSQAGVDYKSFFSTFDISIDTRSNGDPFIKITSPKIVNEPFLNMLIELNWASGRLMREYTVLLDPIDPVNPEPVAPVTNDYTVAVEVHAPEKKPTLYALDEVIDPAESMPAQPSDSQFAGLSYAVKQGDTLSDIARQHFPDSVSLNQVLIAMFRTNRDAFIEDNINLLKAGVVLQMPSQDEVSAISKSEANKEVQVHVADWRSYRNGLVAAASDAPSNEEIAQSDAGQITATMPDEGLINERTPTEVLRLSSGGQTDDVLGDGSLTTQDKLQMMEEDAISRNLALQEANERIAILEKNILDLQRLLQIEDPTLAEAQQQADSLLSPEPVIQEPEMMIEDEMEIYQDSALELDSETIAVISDQTDLLSDTVMDATISPEDAMVQTGAIEPFPSVGEAASDEASSLTTQLMNNIEYVGAAAAFILLGTLAALRLRRKKSEDDFDDEEAEHASSTLRERLASVAAVDSQETFETGSAQPDASDKVETDSDEPVSEVLHEDNADLMDTDFEDDSKHEGGFTSNQTDELDEEVNFDLADAEDNNPQVENNDQFDDTDFDLDLNESTPEVSPEISEQKEPELDINIEDGLTLGSSMEAEPQESVSDDILNLDVAETESSKLPEESVEQAEIETLPFEGSTDFTFDLDTPTETDSSEPDTPVESKSDEKNEESDLGIDFPGVSGSPSPSEIIENIDAPEPSIMQDEESTSDSESKSDASSDLNLLSSDSSLSDLKSEMDISVPDAEDTVDKPSEEMTAGEKDANWHEVETKIDLAKAYLDMEDYEGAKEILDEVIQDGDSQQQENAKTMLAQL